MLRSWNRGLEDCLFLELVMDLIAFFWIFRILEAFDFDIVDKGPIQLSNQISSGQASIIVPTMQDTHTTSARSNKKNHRMSKRSLLLSVGILNICKK